MGHDNTAAVTPAGYESPPPDTPSPLTSSVYNSFDQISPLGAAWNDLAERHGDLFSSYDWCETWWRHFGRGRRLEIHTLQEDGQLLAVLPLFRETIRIGGLALRSIRLLAGDYTIDAAGLAIEPTTTAAFVHLVLDKLSQRGNWDVLHLGPLRSHAAVSDTVAAAASRHPRVQSILIGRRNDWLTVYDLPRTYGDYLQSLQGDERRDTQRRQRQLLEQHDVRIELVTKPEEVDSAMDILVASHRSLWLGRGQQGQFLDWPGFEAFHRDIATRLAGKGHLLMVTLTVDGQPLGAAYGYHFGPRSHTMIRGYCDSAPWRRYALGRLLHCRMTQQAIERGSTTLDDGRGVFGYKLRLGGRLHGERSITIIHRGRRSRLRLWWAMRAAYVVHVVYNRLWRDMLAARLGRVRPLRHVYIRSSFLAHLSRMVRFSPWAGPAVQELTLAETPPDATSAVDDHAMPAPEHTNT